MKPLRARLRSTARRMRVSQMVVEKDYALSYLLAGIAANPALSGTLIEGVELGDLLRRKSAHRDVSYNTLDDFFTAELEAEARRNWEGNLRPFVPELPACDDVLAELKQLLPAFFPGLINRR